MSLKAPFQFPLAGPLPDKDTAKDVEVASVASSNAEYKEFLNVVKKPDTE